MIEIKSFITTNNCTYTYTAFNLLQILCNNQKIDYSVHIKAQTCHFVCLKIPFFSDALNGENKNKANIVTGKLISYTLYDVFACVPVCCGVLLKSKEQSGIIDFSFQNHNSCTIKENEHLGDDAFK